MARGIIGEAASERTEYVFARDRRGGAMLANVIAERARLCLLPEGWAAGGPLEAAAEGAAGGAGEPLCKITLELGGSVYQFKKIKLQYLVLRWMRDGRDSDGRVKAFVEELAPYAAARLPPDVVRPGASRVAIIYRFGR